MARISRLDQREGLIEALATLLMQGLTNVQVADALGEKTSPHSIKHWKKDPRVQAEMARIRQENINQVDSKIVSRLMGLINTPEQLAKLDVDTLLKIRKELLPPATHRVTVSKGADETAALTDLMTLLNERPDIAKHLGLSGPPPDEDRALPEPKQETIDSTGVELPPDEGSRSS